MELNFYCFKIACFTTVIFDFIFSGCIYKIGLLNVILLFSLLYHSFFQGLSDLFFRESVSAEPFFNLLFPIVVTHGLIGYRIMPG